MHEKQAWRLDPIGSLGLTTLAGNYSQSYPQLLWIDEKTFTERAVSEFFQETDEVATSIDAFRPGKIMHHGNDPRSMQVPRLHEKRPHVLFSRWSPSDLFT